MPCAPIGRSSEPRSRRRCGGTARSSRACGRRPRTSSSRECRCRRARSSTCCTARPTTIPRCSKTPTASTSSEPSIDTSGSLRYPQLPGPAARPARADAGAERAPRRAAERSPGPRRSSAVSARGDDADAEGAPSRFRLSSHAYPAAGRADGSSGAWSAGERGDRAPAAVRPDDFGIEPVHAIATSR